MLEQKAEAEATAMTGRPEITTRYIPKPETEHATDRKHNGIDQNQTNGRPDKHQQQNPKNRHKKTKHRRKEDHHLHQNHTKKNPKINNQTTTNDKLQAHKNYISKIIEKKKHTCGIEMHLWTTVHVYE